MNPIFYFDFASPNAYLAHRVIPSIEERAGLAFTYQPVLLGGLFKLTGNQAPMVAFAGVPAKLAYEHREFERFIVRHAITAFRMNPHFPVNTLTVMRGAVAAQSLGLLAAYVEAVFRGLWEEGRKLDDSMVLAQLLADADLPAEDLLTLAQQAPIKDQLALNTQQAFDHGAFGIPSFLVDGELYFGKNTLVEIEQRLTRQPTSA